MEHFVLNGEVRQLGNKASVKEIRRKGLVPCNLYGGGIKNVLFTVSEKDLKTLINTAASFIVDLSLNNGEKHFAIVHELQFHPVKDNCLHVDFLAVTENKPIAIDIPINIKGHSIGVRQGGKFFQLVRKLKVSALMKDLPENLDIDITELGIGKRITAGELKFDKLQILSNKNTIICTVKATRQMMAKGGAEQAEAK